VEKFHRPEQAVDGKMKRAHCMLTKSTNTDSEYVIRIAFSITTMVA